MSSLARDNLERRVRGLFDGSGVAINGPQPWDIQVGDDRFYARVLADGSLGFGDSYVDGWWNCERIDELAARLLRADIPSKLRPSVALIKDALLARLVNRQNKSRVFRNAQAHYDIGNDLYRAMLDRRLTYSCGYWKTAASLDEAQEAKLDLVCRKIGLVAGQSVLDIGCGWGSFAKYAAEKYGARVVGVTVSEEQLKLGRELCRGLPVELRLQDYRDLKGTFNHVVSIGMAEHVGYKNYRAFFEVARRCLVDDGLFLLHTIGENTTARTTDPWIGRYIFPNSMLPSAKQLAESSEGLLVMEDWHNFGSDYDTTLMAWHRNFEAGWDGLAARYDERFRRMWRYYLLVCAGSFRSRSNQLWQIVYSKRGLPGGYASIR